MVRAARRRRHDGAAHHAVPGGGRPAGRRDRGARPRPGHRGRHLGRSSSPGRRAAAARTSPAPGGPARRRGARRRAHARLGPGRRRARASSPSPCPIRRCWSGSAERLDAARPARRRAGAAAAVARRRLPDPDRTGSGPPTPPRRPHDHRHRTAPDPPRTRPARASTDPGRAAALGHARVAGRQQDDPLHRGTARRHPAAGDLPAAVRLRLRRCDRRRPRHLPAVPPARRARADRRVRLGRYRGRAWRTISRPASSTASGACRSPGRRRCSARSGRTSSATSRPAAIMLAFGFALGFRTNGGVLRCARRAGDW